MQNQEPYAPVNVTLVTDSPVAQLANIPAAENYADDVAIKNYCQSELLGIISRTKDRRRLLEDEWLAIQRLRTLTHDGGQKYKGRSNVYLPNYANAHNTLVTQLSKGLFPSDDYMDVEGQIMGSEEAAEQVKSALKYELDCNAKLRQYIKPALSQLVDFGNCVIKYWMRTGSEFVGRKKKGGVAQFKKRPQKGLTVSARSIFNVVVYPETAENENDILITAEYMDIDRNFAIALENSRRWKNTQEALNGGTSSVTSGDLATSRDQSLIDQAKIHGMTEAVDSGSTDKPTAQLVQCIEAYCSIRLPKSAYVEGEDPTLPCPARVVFINGIPVEVTRNMNYDQKHPYLWGRQGVVPGVFYGSWAGRRARYLQYLINDLANQTNDTGIMGLNPFMVVDTNLLTGPLMPYAPGRVFHTRDVKNAIAFQHPPMEPIQYGQNMVNMYAGALVDGIGAPPVLQGVGKSGETATGQSILQRNALSPLQDVVEDLEAQVMVPLLERAWALIVQFADRAIQIQMPDGSMQQVDVGMLDEFDYSFKFLSSSQAANQQAKSQQAIQLLQSLPQTVPLLQANGYMVNPMPVLRKLYSDGFGWRQFDQFVFKMQPQIDPMTGQPMMPGGMPGAPPGGNPGEPTPVRGPEQNAPSGENAGAEPSVGSEELSAVRAPVDEINAMEQGRGLG
jgi:hypothetical protein